MTDPVGPIFTGGFQHVKAGAYELLYLPDLKNDLLQREGKPPVYYWMPNGTRIARANVDAGPAKFHMIHFVGVQSEDTTVGVSGTREVAGGVITFTTTAAPPAKELEASEQELLSRFKGSDDKYWGWRTQVTPSFRPMPIMACTTTLTNLSPESNGTLPVPTGGKSAPGAPRNFRLTGGEGNDRMRVAIRPKSMPRVRDGDVDPSPNVVRSGEVDASANIDPWFINLQGQGEGNINLLGETAYSGLMGSMPAAILWASFHGGTGAIVAAQSYKMKFWAPLIEITIKGSWKSIFEHFSAAASADFFWSSADVAILDLNEMRKTGKIEVSIVIDPTIPGADKMQADIDKKTDVILQKFMDAAQKVIFEPPAPQVEPAKADSGGWFWGGSASFKLRKDVTTLDLYYHEKREMAYIQNNTISSSLGGFIDEIKANPEEEKRYFTTLYLGDWDRKVSRTVKAIVNWPDPSRKWVGEPVAFISAQLGYADTNGQLQWTGHMFQASDPPDYVWHSAVEKKEAANVKKPPAGWKPDISFVKRKIHFLEPPDESAYPYSRIFIERNEVDLDPTPNGTPTNELNLEVRADSVGKLDIGPLALNVDSDSPKQIVEITFTCLGTTLDGMPRNPTKFQWSYENQTEPRYWAIYSGDLKFVPHFKYQVKVIVKGSLFTKGMEWTGPEVETTGNGPTMISVPTPEDPGVTVTREAPWAGTITPPADTVGAPPVGTNTGVGAPPPRIGWGVGAPPKIPAGLPPASHRGTSYGSGKGIDVYGYKTTPVGVASKGSSGTRNRGIGDTPLMEGWTTVDPTKRRPPRSE